MQALPFESRHTDRERSDDQKLMSHCSRARQPSSSEPPDRVDSRCETSSVSLLLWPAKNQFAPNVNSYRRITPYSDAPINTHWGIDNRTVGLRVPDSKPAAYRVENRVAGADANPYLAIAGTLACGLLGLKDKLEPTRPIEGDAYRLAFNLPRHLEDSLSKLNYAKPLKLVLGEQFVKLLAEVKTYESDLYQRVISSWERENLLLNV